MDAASSTGAAPPATAPAEQQPVSMEVDAGGRQAPTPASGEAAPTPALQYSTREEFDAAEMAFLSRDWLQFQRARPAKDIASAHRLAPQERRAPSATPTPGVQLAPAPAGAAAPTPKVTMPSFPLRDEEDIEPPTLIQDMLKDIEDDEAWDALQREKEDAWRHHLPQAWAQAVDGLLEQPMDDLTPFLRVWRHLAQHLNIVTGHLSSDWPRRPRDSQWEAVESRIWAVRKAVRDAAWGLPSSWKTVEERDRQCGRDKADLLALTHELMKPGEGPKGFVPDELTEDGFREAMEEIGREWADRHFALMKEGWDRGLHSKEMKATVPFLVVSPLSDKPSARRPPEVDAMDFNLWVDAILAHAELRIMRRSAPESRGTQQQQPKRVDTPIVRSPAGGTTPPPLGSVDSKVQRDSLPQVRVAISAKEWRSAEEALEEYLRQQVTRQRHSEAERHLGARPKEQRQPRKGTAPQLPAPLDLLPGKKTQPRKETVGQAPPVPAPAPVPAAPAAAAVVPPPPAEAPQQPVPTPKAPLSYAKAAAKPPSADGAGGAGGGGAGTGAKSQQQQQQQQGRPRPTPMPGRVPNWEDILAEDDMYLQNFFADYPGEKDPDQRYVVRLTYVGNDISKLSRKYLESEVIEKALGFSSLEVWALVTPMGTRDADLCFRTEKDYRHFWAKLREAREADPSFLTDFHLTPIFRCDIKVITVFFRNTAIPEEDVGKWLEQRCQVLKYPERSYDIKGYFTGEFKAIIKLWRETDSGFLKHVPKYFYLGADRGATRYSGQPMACFQCGGWRHIRSQCRTTMCARCSAPGHRTSDCSKPSLCNLCGERGHEYKLCPEAYVNLCNPERYAKARAEAEQSGLYKDQQSDSETEEPVRGAEAPSTSAQEEQWRKPRSRRRRNKATVITRTAEGTGVPPARSPEKQQQQEAAAPQPPQQQSKEQAEQELSSRDIATSAPMAAPLNARQRRKEERRLAGLDKKYQAQLVEEQLQRLRDLEEVKRQLEQKLRDQQAQQAQGGTEAEESDMEVTTPSRKRRSEVVASRLSPPETVQKVKVTETAPEVPPTAKGEQEVQSEDRPSEKVTVRPTPVPSPKVPTPAQAPAPSIEPPAMPETKEVPQQLQSAQQEQVSVPVEVQKSEISTFVFQPTLSPTKQHQDASRREAKVFRFQAWTSDSGYGSDPPPPQQKTISKASLEPHQDQQAPLEAVPEEGEKQETQANPFDGMAMHIGRRRQSVGKFRKVVIPGLPKKEKEKRKVAPKGEPKASPQIATVAVVAVPAVPPSAATDGRTVPPSDTSVELTSSSSQPSGGEDSATT